MLNWNDYVAKQEYYNNMLRAADKQRLVNEAQSQRQQRLAFRVRLLRWLGRSMVAWGGRLEARYGH